MIERFALNENIFYWINSFAGKNDFFDRVFILFGEYTIFIMIFIFILFFAKKIWKDKKIELWEIFLYFSTPVLAWFVTHILKWFFPTGRPYTMENTIQLSAEFDPGSFPSGHTTLAFAMAVNIYFYNKKLGILFFIFATMVAFGRVLVGLHFPLDIFAGMILGILIPVIFYNKLWKNFKK